MNFFKSLDVRSLERFVPMSFVNSISEILQRFVVSACKIGTANWKDTSISVQPCVAWARGRSRLTTASLFHLTPVPSYSTESVEFRKVVSFRLANRKARTSHVLTPTIPFPILFFFRPRLFTMEISVSNSRVVSSKIRARYSSLFGIFPSLDRV